METFNVNTMYIYILRALECKQIHSLNHQKYIRSVKLEYIKQTTEI